MKKIKRVSDGPVNLGGMLGRIVEFEDGSGSAQTWGGTNRGWVHGGADIYGIMVAIPASLNTLIEYGVPKEDWPPEILEEWRGKQGQ